MHFAAAGITHPGLVRTSNQDAFYASANLLIVADGVGGLPGGEEAAKLTVATISANFDGTLSSLYASVEEAHKAVQGLHAHAATYGAATTLVLVALTDEGLMAVWSGDSRIYLLQDERLYQVSEDDSLVQSLVNSGHITAEEALTHPRRNVITRSIGGGEMGSGSLAISSVRLDEEGKFLLCSDGVSNELSKTQLEAFLREDLVEDELCKKIAAATLNTRARDNLTAVIGNIAP